MNRDKLLDYILSFMPLLHKKLFKEHHGYKMSRHQMGILFSIKKENGKPMKHYCEKLMISKPNLSTVVNKLIEEDLLERKTDKKDRRIINLYITDAGEKLLTTQMDIVKKDMLNKLEVLSDDDIEKLIKNFEEMKSIFSKLE